jgi:hypothetical protein
MGPYSEKKQWERAGAIKRLLENNPQLDDYMKSIWQRKLRELALSEDEYNLRVREIFSRVKKWNYA